MANEAEERTEAPTARRLGEARSRGQIARSVEIQSAAVLLAGVVLLQGPGASFVAHFNQALRESLADLPVGPVNGQALGELLLARFLPVAVDLALIVLGLGLAGMIASLAQTGLNWASQRPWFDASRINLLSGFQNLLSLNGLIELFKAGLKLAVIGLVAYNFLLAEQATFATLSQMALRDSLVVWAGLVFGLFWRVVVAYIFLAVLDYGYQRWQWMKSLKMTKQEVKEEMKQNEGNPQIKSYIRQQARKLARARMLAAVPRADVVITNPTHFAVALKYERQAMAAPTVVAKGADSLALRIRELARASQVPLVENPPLARTLHKLVEVDQQVPPQLYLAVAEVLAFVYRLKRGAGVRRQASETAASPRLPRYASPTPNATAASPDA
jgi:flagellar biosynthetic protein FlhB